VGVLLSGLPPFSDLLQHLSEMRNPDADATERGTVAKNLILNFRKIKTVFRDADTAVEEEARSDEALFAHLCKLLEEVRAPDDYVTDSQAEKELLGAVQTLHDTLRSKQAAFGKWDEFVEDFEDILASFTNVSSVIRKLRHSVTAPEVVSKISFFVNALEYHQARLTLVMANACLHTHNTQPERVELLQSQDYPPLASYTRPGVAFSGIIQLLLNLVPVVFQSCRDE
jgi:hypothetical protein